MENIQNIENILKKDGFVISGYSGKSMYPLLRRKTEKLVIRKGNNEIKKLDIVLYKIENKYVLHRVIGIEENVLIIRGDNVVLTEHINIDKVYGVLIGFFNSNKYIDINDKLNRKYYYLSLVTFPLRKIKHLIGKIIKKYE